MPEAPLSTFGSWVISWGALSLFAGTLLAIGFGVLSMNPAQYSIALACFSGSELLVILRAGWWLGVEQSGASLRHRLLLSVIVFGINEGSERAVEVSERRRFKKQQVLALAEFRRCGFADATFGPPWRVVTLQRCWLLLWSRRELPSKRDVLACIFLKIGQVLVVNLEDLAFAYQNVFAAIFDARQRTVFV
jgi:hypothetical protein